MSILVHTIYFYYSLASTAILPCVSERDQQLNTATVELGDLGASLLPLILSQETFSFNKIRFSLVVQFVFWKKKIELDRKCSVDRMEHFVKIKYDIIVNCKWKLENMDFLKLQTKVFQTIYRHFSDEYFFRIKIRQR